MHDAAISIDLLKNAGTWEINAIQSQIFYLMMFSTFQISTSNFNRLTYLSYSPGALVQNLQINVFTLSICSSIINLKPNSNHTWLARVIQELY